MKRVLAMLLSAIMVLTMVPGMAFAAEDGGDTQKSVTVTASSKDPLTYGYTDSITLTAEAKNFTESNPSYQWQEKKEDSFTDIADSTNASYEVAKDLDAGTYEYRCVAKDGDSDQEGTASESVTVTVNAKALTADMVTFADTENNGTYELTEEGKAVTPEVVVKDGKNTLSADTDYTLEYKNNTEVTKDATVTVTAVKDSNYSGSATKTFEIVKKPVDISSASVELEQVGLTYNGTAQEPAVKAVKVDEKVLTAEEDYTVEYSDNTNAGTATVTVTGKGNYTGTATTTFTITKLSVTELAVELEKAETTYTGEAQTPAIKSVKAGEVTLQKDDYTVDYTDEKGDTVQAENIKNAAKYGVKVTVNKDGQNCEGTAEKVVDFTINPAEAKGKVRLICNDASDDGLNENDTVKADITGVTPADDSEGGVAYEWQKDGKNIESATSDTYTIASTDMAGVLTCKVTFTGNRTGEITSESVTIGKKLLKGTLKVEANEAKTELTLSGVDSDIAKENYTIAWYRNGDLIKDATGETYAIVKPADLGKTITAEITATGDTYTGSLHTEQGYEVPAEKPEAPVITATAGDQSVTVKWEKPEENGAPITGYSLKVTKEVAEEQPAPEKPEATAEEETEAETPTEPAVKTEEITGSPFTIGANEVERTVAELDNGTEYTFTMTATNSAGTSDASEAVKATPKVPAKVYTIKYMSDGKVITVTGNPTQYTEGDAAVTLKNPPARTGYTFGGWYANSKFTGTKVTKIVNLTTDTTLYAKWTPTTYTITYKANNGTLAQGTQKSYNITTATFTLKNPTRKGYTFGGWYTSSKFTAASKVTSIKKGSTGNKTLYAKWTVNTYKITYYANKGTLAKGTQKSYKVTTATFTLKNPTRKGYTFAGWYTTNKYKTKATKVVKGSTGNKVFYAKWNKVTVAKAKTPVLTNLKGRSLRVKYSATTGAKGYQIQYATNKKFSKAVTKITTAKTYTVKKLKKGKTYYVRVRAYKTDSKGYKVYGSWSTVKSKKITK